MLNYLSSIYKRLLSFIYIYVPYIIVKVITSQNLRSINKLILVHPCVIKGLSALVYAQGLAEHNKSSFDDLCVFAKTNGLKLKENQRSISKIVKQERRAIVIPAIILGASLLAQNTFAVTTINNTNSNKFFGSKKQLSYISGNKAEKYLNEDQLISDLLNWINQHTSLTYLSDQIPKLKIVTAKEISEVAFGAVIPEAVNPKNLNIIGLYNFNEKTIYILDAVKINTEQGKAILLHELVHYIQYQTGKDKMVNCIKELEPEAYNIEEAYLNKHGIVIDLNHAGVC